MQYIEAPNEWDITTTPADYTSLFLAGGITGCADWQKTILYGHFNANMPVVFLNPRRAEWPMGDPDAAYDQIAWEHRHLRKAENILFWFAAETMQPIVLFEFGRWTASNKTIFVGVDPKYPRKQDVEIQLKLERPALKIASCLEELALDFKQYLAKRSQAAF